MNADLVMQHKYRTFQVLVAFLKFDALYVLEYIVQIIMVVPNSEGPPLGNISHWVTPVLWTMLSMSFLLFLATAYCVRHEHTLRTFILMPYIGGGKMAALLEENFEMETLRNDSSTAMTEA
ncbi:hypothetical protein N7481_000181 [Penicillium waksmanii]|uniref:uncharacterized protein n=1 Tax=Penicillium waksmanii TaxID=69791 RepID=UPI00254837B2|nr:uncharacterized protein N7481_000181 [Penicillium waksmanii]KAJ5999772.1 hypothetical protein N7481_000181 [Penicillium waksmanii]